MKKTLGFGSCVKHFAQQKWFLVASKSKRSEHSRKHINRLIPFLKLWSPISLFFFFFRAFFNEAKAKPGAVFENPDYHFPFYVGFP